MTLRAVDEIRHFIDALHQLMSGELAAEHRRVMQELDRSLADLMATVQEQAERAHEAQCRFRRPKPKPLKTAKPGRSPDADTVGTVRNQRSPGPFVHSVPRGSSGKRRG